MPQQPSQGPMPCAVPVDGLEDMLSAVRERLFEVVLAAGVEPDLAFSVLDRDGFALRLSAVAVCSKLWCPGDGMVSMEDVVALLHHLGLPLPQDLFNSCYSCLVEIESLPRLVGLHIESHW